jgi:anti-anti-sigma factor
VQVDVAHFEHRVIVAIHGNFDAHTADDFARGIREILSSDLRTLVLDLNYCTFIDTVGAAALIALREQAGEHGTTLQLTSVPRAITPALRTVGLLQEEAGR